MLSRGSSQHWTQTLAEFTGSDTVTADALLNYFQPLETFLQEQIEKLNITVGW